MIKKINDIEITNYDTIYWSFFDTNVRNVFVPFNGESESTIAQRYTRWYAPADCRIIGLTWSMLGGTYSTGNLTWEMRRYVGNTLTTTDSQTLVTPYTIYDPLHLTFNLDLAKGEVLQLFMINNLGSGVSNINGNVLIQWT